MKNAFIELLNKNVLDVNVTDENGNTPLITAALSGCHMIAQLLLKRSDVDIFHKNNNGDDALSIALKKYDNFKDIKTNDPNEYRDLLLQALNNNEEYIRSFAMRNQINISNDNHFGIITNHTPNRQPPNQATWNFNFTNSQNTHTFQMLNFNFNFNTK